MRCTFQMSRTTVIDDFNRAPAPILKRNGEVIDDLHLLFTWFLSSIHHKMLHKNCTSDTIQNSVTFSLSENNPSCSHGRMLSIFRPKTETAPRYVCSAFSRKLDCECDTSKSLDSKWPVRPLRRIQPERRGYCATCDCLFINSDNESFLHKDHNTRVGITDRLLKMPSFLLSSLSDASAHAQYMFSLETLNNLYSVLLQINVQFVLCFGTPRLHDFIRLQREINKQNMNSFLLDLDARLCHFYDCKEFARFNMINGHFFTTHGLHDLTEFTRAIPTTARYAMICDPPFKAPLILLIEQMRLLSTRLLADVSRWGIRSLPVDGLTSPTFLILPYFFEKKLRQIDKEFAQLDYKITYDNHPRFDWDAMKAVDENHEPKGRRRDSIVRLFTNVDPAIVLPPEMHKSKFWFCQKCQRYSAKANQHCDACGICPTKHGSTYIHCAQCQRCRPANRVHCVNCARCVAPDQCPHRTVTTECKYKAKRKRKH